MSKYVYWPWPSKLPLKPHWWTPADTTHSISQSTRRVTVLGDIAVVGVVLFAATRAWGNQTHGRNQSRLRHLTQHPPAIVAQDYDFTKPISENRVLTRERLQEYRNECGEARRGNKPVEEFIFKY